MDVEKYLMATMEHDVLNVLMAGNDTMCFTTEQYYDARDDWIAKHMGPKDRVRTREEMRRELGVDGHLREYSIELCRYQLRAFPRIKEVKPDVWTYNDQLR